MPTNEFIQIQQQTIESLSMEVTAYEHKATGALHYHLASDNPENVFLVALRTVPTDSTGVAHVLEHTVLCGSEQYPVRDPFFLMIRRSLNTFMNAFTASDWTAYPFATQNRKDFNNLLKVYLDAVFFPKLDPLDFAQEGYRLEFSNPSDPNTELMYKGVVYNEMKGAMSSPVSLLWQTATRYLYPSSTYHYNSGGDPEDIVDLTHEQLKAFYKKHYHPSNATFFTFGNIPAEEHQAVFHEHVLKKFERSNEHINISPEKRYFSPLIIEDAYPLDDASGLEQKTHIVLGWLLDKNTDTYQRLKLQLLSNVLLDNSSSPLLNALETTELGKAPSPLCGLEDEQSELSFMCGLEGSEPRHAQAVETLIIDTLKKVVEQGVEPKQLEAALQQLEISQREITGGRYPYGLQLILQAMPAAIHRIDPIDALNTDPALTQLREDIKNPRFLPTLIQTMLLDNPHRIRLTLKPDPLLSKRRDKQLQSDLALIKQHLNQSEKQAILDKSSALEKHQMAEDDKSVLPKVELSDVPPELSVPSAEDSTLGSQPLSFYGQTTNGVIYQDIVIPLPKLDTELQTLLPYYTDFVTDLGSAGRDYLQTQAEQARLTGGLFSQVSIHSRVDDKNVILGHVSFGGKSLKRHDKDLMRLLDETLHRVRFDETAYLNDCLSQARARQERSITGNGHTLAMMAAAAGSSFIGQLSHQLYGLGGIQHIKRLTDSIQADKKALSVFAQQLERLHQQLLGLPRRYLSIADTNDKKQLIEVLAQEWMDTKPAHHEFTPFEGSAVNKIIQQAWITNTQVNFCAKSYPTVPVEHPDSAALTVLAPLLRNGFLHSAIREKGGAYGGGASHNSGSATFNFYSYRDPRVQETLNDFDRSIDWILTEKPTSVLLEEAILGVISGIDKPSSPAQEAKKAYYQALIGCSYEQRQQHRQRILAVTSDDLQRVASTYLKTEKASTAIITNAAELNKEGTEGLEILRV